eukprot:m.261852 g.261852  ORF g.261852 m.261852 type:complete len:86 (-) comp15581_c0_seq4:378-635(-)
MQLLIQCCCLHNIDAATYEPPNVSSCAGVLLPARRCMKTTVALFKLVRLWPHQQWMRFIICLCATSAALTSKQPFALSAQCSSVF